MQLTSRHVSLKHLLRCFIEVQPLRAATTSQVKQVSSKNTATTFIFPQRRFLMMISKCITISCVSSAHPKAPQARVNYSTGPTHACWHRHFGRSGFTNAHNTYLPCACIVLCLQPTLKRSVCSVDTEALTAPMLLACDCTHAQSF